MPSLLCDLRLGVTGAAEEYRALRAVGAALALFWPAAEMATLGPEFAEVRDAAGMHAAWEEERIAVLHPGEGVPAWLALEEFDRVLLMSATAVLSATERELAEGLLRAGAEAVEVVPQAAAQDLAQSWHSGRRAGAFWLTA
jgi:hypothetical protein